MKVVRLALNCFGEQIRHHLDLVSWTVVGVRLVYSVHEKVTTLPGRLPISLAHVGTSSGSYGVLSGAS